MRMAKITARLLSHPDGITPNNFPRVPAASINKKATCFAILALGIW
jgi:hypothetical protein